MNRVTKRTWLMGLFVLVLLGGMVFFLYDYICNASTWVSSPGSPHITHSSANMGMVTDRSGTLLMNIGSGRSYAENQTTRKSTLHWLGDREGNIHAAAISGFSGDLLGFDPVNGIYDADGEGGTITLTLSAAVQNTALEALGKRKGTVAVYNYQTGEILCAVTSPTYDPDNPPDISQDPSGTYEGVYLNRFTQVTYPPGSIFKIVTTAAALDTVPGIQNMTFHCTGTVEYGEGEERAKVTCENPHGTVSLKTALSNSCNCAFAQIAELVGRDNMKKKVAELGVTDPVTFDGITTARGKYDISGAGSASFAWSCIGQHTNLINPARFMTLMGAIGGGGKAAQPYLVSRVSHGEEVTYAAKTQMTEKYLSRETAETLKAYMRSNVKNIYGDWNFNGLNVCGKSGTSQLGGEEVSNAMFAGFVMDEAYPLAFVCVVENGGYGASACVPVLSKVLNACVSAMNGG